MGNRLGGEKAYIRFPVIRPVRNFVTTSIDSLAILWKVRCCLNISTHPPQCSKLLVFSAVSVKERFEEDLTAKVQKLHRVSLNKINCLTFDKKSLSRNTLIPEIIDITHHHPHFSPKMISHYNNFWGSIFEYTVYFLIYRTAKIIILEIVRV